MSNPQQEQAWLKQALAGDQSAFGKLAEVYQAPVYNLAYRMLGNAGEAEEAAQETFLKAYTHLRTYDQTRKFSTWLLSIASHHCIDRLRRRRFTWLSMDDNPMLGWLTAEQGKPEESVLRVEAGDEVRDLLSQLEPPYRLPLILRYWHDLSYEEIAETLGITEAAVKSRLHRARHQMADAMAQRDTMRLARSPSVPGIMQVF